jgi:ABC-type multidrug transport system fused ATPase/permease subunit
MVLMGPLNALVARRMKVLQIEQMKNKDKRQKMMDEILNGMKILKLYAWEASFAGKVTAIRALEIASLKKIAYLNAAMTFLWVCAPTMVALASFATYVLVDPKFVSFSPIIALIMWSF